MMTAVRSDAEVNISYCGVGLDSLLDCLDSVRAPLLLHIADRDDQCPPEGRARIVQALEGHGLARACVYSDAGHAVARVGGTQWQTRAAAIANGRSRGARGVAGIGRSA